MINKQFRSALHWEWHEGLDEHQLYNGQVLTHFAVYTCPRGWIANFGVYGPEYPVEEVRTTYETLESAKLACEDFFDLENGEFPIVASRRDLGL